MTDRHCGYIVVLEKDIREDDAERLKMAIVQLKGVLSIEPVVSDGSVQIATARARWELVEKIMELVRRESGQ